MKKSLLAACGVVLLCANPALAVDGDAVVGGAIGGGVGAAVGSEIGGREGAIAGGAIGAAIGTAIATDDDDGRKTERNVVEVEVHERHHHGPPGHAYGHRVPPGHAKHKHKHR